MRTITLFRSLPTSIMGNSTWFDETTDADYGTKKLVPGELGVPACDELGIPYARLVSGSPYPTPINFNSVPMNAAFADTNYGIVCASGQYVYVPAFAGWGQVTGDVWGGATIAQTNKFGPDVNAAVYLNDGSTTSVVAIAADQSTMAPGVINRGVQVVTPPGDWSIRHTPALNVQATITRAVGAAGQCHMATSISACVLLGAGAAAANIDVVLRDGAAGVGAILWSRALTVVGSAAGSQCTVDLSGLSIIGTAATAMTLEVTAAPGAANRASVALTGRTIPA